MMIDLKKQYQKAKSKAVKLMRAGRVSEYVAQLVTVQELRLQILNAAMNSYPGR